MADVLVQTCFAFRCRAEEWALMQEAFQLSLDLCADVQPGLPSTAFMTLFPADGEDQWSGFRDLFDDRDFPDFGADLAGGAEDGSTNWHAIISSEVSLEASAVAAVIQRCCGATLANGPIGFEWSISCSRQRVEAFGGGWCAIYADHLVIGTTNGALVAALDKDIARRASVRST